MNPTEHVYDSTSETGYNVLVGGSEYYNPLAEVMLKQADNVDKWLKADATVKLNLPAGFSTQATLWLGRSPVSADTLYVRVTQNLFKWKL